MNNFGYVYLTTNLLNGKKYIGKRYGEFSEVYYGSGKLLKLSIKKYGIEHFICEVLENCKNEEDINKKEIYYIKLLQPEYNLAEGGTGGDTLKFQNYEIKQGVINKRAESLRETWKTKSDDEIIRWGKSISESKKGKSNGREGFITSEETKRKISESNKLAAKSRSSTWRENHSKKMMEKRGIPNKKNWTPVIVDGVKYDGIIDAANKLNVVRQTISKWIKNGRGEYIKK